MLGALELRARPGADHQRWSVHRDDVLRLLRLSATVALIAVAGCGGTETGQQGSGAEIVVATLGDSITAGSPAWDPDPEVRDRLGVESNPESQYQYWANAEDRRLSFRNCGVFGERTDQIADRLQSCADGADALVIQGGINDIAQGRPIEDVAADLREMVEQGGELGRVAIANVLPWNNGYPDADPMIRRLNRLIERIGRDQGVPVLQFHDTLEDPDHPGRMRAAWTSDGDHPSVAGYRRLGEIAFRLR